MDGALTHSGAIPRLFPSSEHLVGGLLSTWFDQSWEKPYESNKTLIFHMTERRFVWITEAAEATITACFFALAAFPT